MANIIFLLETIYSNIFRYIYLRKEKLFRNFFLHFWNLDSIWNIFEKNMTLISDVVLNLRTPKNVAR